MIDTTSATRDPLQHAVALANVFTQTAIDAAGCNTQPVAITVRNHYQTGADLRVVVQIGNQDTAAVDRLADHYGLPANTDTEHANYNREGFTTIAGDPVSLHVFSGRPEGGK